MTGPSRTRSSSGRTPASPTCSPIRCRPGPEGVHCENTKIWTYCMTAAGLGMHLFDRLYSQASHWAFQEWVEYAKKALHDLYARRPPRRPWRCTTTPRSTTCTGAALAGGMGVAWVHAAAEQATGRDHAYTAAVESGGLERCFEAGSRGLGAAWRWGLVMAQELGDQITEVRLRDAVESRCEPRFFGADEEEFGWWFGLGEDWPRGQLSAYTMLAEIGTEGSWWRIFNRPNLGKFDEPEVTGVDYPTLGISQAWNDLEHGLLKIDTYAATGSRRGDATQFRVDRLPDADAVFVRLDGEPFFQWRRTDDGGSRSTQMWASTRFRSSPAIAARAIAGAAKRPARPGCHPPIA